MLKDFGAKMSQKYPKISQKLVESGANIRQNLVESEAEIRKLESYNARTYYPRKETS